MPGFAKYDSTIWNTEKVTVQSVLQCNGQYRISSARCNDQDGILLQSLTNKTIMYFIGANIWTRIYQDQILYDTYLLWSQMYLLCAQHYFLYRMLFY